MPTNEDGVEVNEDGSEITPEQLETSDWTSVLKLMEKDNVKSLDMETLAPTSVPHNIPYLEVYRTDEVYFKEYQSPFLSNSGNTTLEPTTEEITTDANATAENSGKITASNVGDKMGAKGGGNNVKSSKTKNSKLSDEILSIVKKNYKSTANYKTLVNRYMSANATKNSISAVTKRSSIHLEASVNPSTVNSAILDVKKKYK